MSDLVDFRDRVKAANNIVDVIRDSGVPLTGGPNEFKALCCFHPEQTPSLTVNSEKQIFCCFGCNAKGDVFDFLMRTKGFDFNTALKFLADRAGLVHPDRKIFRPAAPPNATAPAVKRTSFDPNRFKPLVPGGAVFKYLTEVRKLDPRLLAEYGVCETREGDAYVLPYRWHEPRDEKDSQFLKQGIPESGQEPKLEFAKVVKLARPNGKKQEWREPSGGKNILFGLLTVPEDVDELVVTEGELDAISWRQYGFYAVSVPCGAGSDSWIAPCYPLLERFKKIHFSFDEDRAGRKNVESLVTRLGAGRADIIRLPEKSPGVRFKDCNEALQAGVANEVMQRCVAAPDVLRPKTLKNIYDFQQDIWRKFYPEDKEQLGLLLPCGNLHGSSLPYRIRYGEVTVLTGYNKSGKSEFLNHCIIDLCLGQGDRALICSLEVPAPETYRKLLRMAHGRRSICQKDERDRFDEYLRPLADKIFVYDHVGTAKVDDVLEVAKYAFHRYGCRQFVFDSLMCFQDLEGEGQDQWNAQKAFVERLRTFAAQYGVHVHLVCHSKKPDKAGDSKIPRRYDIAGSSYLSNLPHNVLVVWRNRRKQDKLEEFFQEFDGEFAKRHPGEGMPDWKRILSGCPPKEAGPVALEAWKTMEKFLTREIPSEKWSEFVSVAREHDAYLIVDAQRGGEGDCPVRKLWFHADSLQFIEASPLDTTLGQRDPRNHPVNYVERLSTRQMDEPL